MPEGLLWVLEPFTLLLIVSGTILGVIFGAIPGLTATLAVILLIPLTYGMEPGQGMAMLIAVYIGGISGGVVAAALLGMPGTPASIATTLDAYPLAKRGYANKALVVGVTSNLVGCLIGWMFLITLAPQIARFALEFGPVENVAVLLFGFTTIIGLASGSLRRSLAMAALGLAFSTIGMDPISGLERNTLGFNFLTGGVTTIAAMVGLFVVAQAFADMDDAHKEAELIKSTSKERFMTWREIKASIGNFIRSGLIGTGIGLLPGIGGTLASLIAYDQAKKASKEPETFGTGQIQGIIAPETANNAAIGAALIPFLALGIPGDGVTAALMGGLQIHGLDPGPMLFSKHLTMVHGLFFSFLLASLVMYFFMAVIGSYIFPFILRVKKKFIFPLVLVMSLVGCYNMEYSTSALIVAFFFGVLGYFMRKYKYPAVPLVIGIILGPLFERQLRLAIIQTQGSLWPFISSPIPILFIALAIASLVISMRTRKRDSA